MENTSQNAIRRDRTRESNKRVLEFLIFIPVIVLFIYVATRTSAVSSLVIKDSGTQRTIDVTLPLKPGDVTDAFGEPLELTYGVSGPESVMLYYDGASFLFSASENGAGDGEAILTRVMITSGDLRLSKGNIGVGVQRSMVQSLFSKNDYAGGDGETWDVYYVGSGTNVIEAEFIYDSEGLLSAINLTRAI